MPRKEVQFSLAQLILLNGMTTDANIPGTEKVTCTTLQGGWLHLPALTVSQSQIHVDEKLAPPQSIFLVKGWNRCCCCLGVLWALYQRPDLFEAMLFPRVLSFCGVQPFVEHTSWGTMLVPLRRRQHRSL